MNVISFYESDRQVHWLTEIGKSDWSASRYLHDLLQRGMFFDAVGVSSKVLLLTEGDALVSFCTYAEKDDIQPTTLTPWMGFVYTFPAYRGHRYMRLLFDEIERLAKAQGVSEVYISTDSVGLYEKYGCKFLTRMKDMHDQWSNVYVKPVSRQRGRDHDR